MPSISRTSIPSTFRTGWVKATSSGSRTPAYAPVTWSAGRLTGDAPDQPCDLLAVDEAYPVPVADDGTRLLAHQAWQHGQVLLIAYDGRLALAVPGNRFTADLALDALDRLARAVGAPSRELCGATQHRVLDGPT